MTNIPSDLASKKFLSVNSLKILIIYAHIQFNASNPQFFYIMLNSLGKYFK